MWDFLSDLPRRVLFRHTDKLLEAGLAALMERLFGIALEVGPHLLKSAAAGLLILGGCNWHHGG